MLCDEQNSTSSSTLNNVDLVIDNIIYKTACNPSLLPAIYEDLINKREKITIATLIKVIPSSRTTLTRLITKSFPFPNDTIDRIKEYISMMIELNSELYLPEIFEKLIEWEMEALIDDTCMNEIICHIIDLLEPQMNIIFYDKIILENIFYGKIVNSSLGLNLLPWFCYFWIIRSDEYIDVFLGTLMDRLFLQEMNNTIEILIGYIVSFIETSRKFVKNELVELVVQLLRYYCFNLTKKNLLDQVNLAIVYILNGIDEEKKENLKMFLPFNRNNLLIPSDDNDNKDENEIETENLNVDNKSKNENKENKETMNESLKEPQSKLIIEENENGLIKSKKIKEKLIKIFK